ncbi:MAG: Rpn family recombination-promoting nuclease/putative transposase [Bacteroidales bacterium]|nr:Rpn family recombination-promoting nuclease/putative transposase [Bacteroidales bacterium]
MQKRFICPLTDFGFKRIFGNKDILLAFLNDLFEGEVQFTDLVYSDKEIKGDSEEGKTVIYDIHCTTSSGEKIIVEMQNESTLGFKERMVYYMARDVANQGEAGKGWHYVNLKAVYSIIFTNFGLFEGSDLSLRHDIKLFDVTTNETFSDKIRMVCLQIPLTVEEPLQGETKLDTWMYNLKNMGTMQQLTNTEDMPIFKRLEQVAEYHQLSPEDRLAYDISYKHYLDAYNLEFSRKEKMRIAIETSMAKGMAEGRAIGEAEGRAKGEAEGRAKGEAEGRAIGEAKGRVEGRVEGKREGERTKQLEIASNLKTYGMPSDQIALMTGLSAEEIENL